MTDELADDHELGVQLRAVLGDLYRRVRQAKASDGLAAPERAALSRITRQGPMTAAELARLERISPQSIAATLRALRSAGLVERRPDAQDGRRLILSLTAAGERVVADRRAARTEQLTGALHALSPAQRAQLAAALPALRRLAEEL